MRRSFFIPLLLIMTTVNTLGQYSAMTYNIRYATERDGINSWENRKEWVSDLLDYYAPDFFGIQEGLHHQVTYLDSSLVDYSFVGVGRDDGAASGEYASIFFNDSKLSVINSGTFWLSLTPDEPSFGWGANFRRICTWAQFEDVNSGEQFFVFNAHFDHESELAREESAKLMMKLASEYNPSNSPVILMGDFNATPNQLPIKIFGEVYYDTFDHSIKQPFGPVGTYNGFDTSHPLDKRIDYIFVSNKITVDSYVVLSNSRQNRTPSDHLPVLVHFSLD